MTETKKHFIPCEPQTSPPTIYTHAQMDLLYDLCVKPEKKKLLDQLAKGNSMLPKEMDKEMMWTTVMKTKNTLRTMDDPLFYVFVLLAGCPKYLAYVTEHSNADAMAVFMPKLRIAFNTFHQGRARNGNKAETVHQKKYNSTVDLVMDMRSLYCKL